VNLSSFALKGYEQYFALGVLFLIIATLSWSFGVMVAIKKAPLANVVVVASVQMIVGGVVSLVASGLMGEFTEIDTSKFDSRLITAFAYLLFVASVSGFLVFNWVSREASPTLVATYNYVNPLVAISLGVYLNNESINTQFIFAAIAIIFAVILITTDKNKG
jgi:drug/metabolite transporter (DMT)-like permease